MGKPKFDRIKKTLAILLVVLFAATVTVGVVSARQSDAEIYRRAFNQGVIEGRSVGAQDALNGVQNTQTPDSAEDEANEIFDNLATANGNIQDITTLANTDGFEDGYNSPQGNPAAWKIRTYAHDVQNHTN